MNVYVWDSIVVCSSDHRDAAVVVAASLSEATRMLKEAEGYDVGAPTRTFPTDPDVYPEVMAFADPRCR